MITGELKASVDRIWDAFWSGGIANPLEVMEQITYLLFIRRGTGRSAHRVCGAPDRWVRLRVLPHSRKA
jgi:hypothetical protein